MQFLQPNLSNSHDVWAACSSYVFKRACCSMMMRPVLSCKLNKYCMCAIFSMASSTSLLMTALVHGAMGLMGMSTRISQEFRPRARKWSATVDGDQPIIAEANECTQQHSRVARAVSTHIPKTAILIERVVGVVIHVNLQKQTTKHITNPLQSPRNEKR
jgi:hypothetical protein